MNVRSIFAGTLTLLLTFSFVSPALAHVGTPRLEISAEQVNPGGVMDLRGVGFDYEESVTLYLERPGIVVQLGSVTADVEGIFLHIAVLPVDLPEGVYNIRGVTSHHEVLSPALIVQGSALIEGGGQGERDEDDGLLAPMPTYAPGVVPGGLSQSPSQPTPHAALKTPTLKGISATLIYAILLGIAILALLSIRILKRP